MSLINWTQEQFGTSVSTHDEEHKDIFARLNALDDAVKSGDRGVIGKDLDDLISVVADHFASEEANFKKFGYPQYEAHNAEHDKLVATCVDLQKRFHAGEANVDASTTGFVKEWLVAHIPAIDKQYGPFLNSKGVA